MKFLWFFGALGTSVFVCAIAIAWASLKRSIPNKSPAGGRGICARARVLTRRCYLMMIMNPPGFRVTSMLSISA